MNTNTKKQINVAPSSRDGHYVSGAKKVVMLDQVTESFLVEGASELVSTNHTTLNTEDDCLISCQRVYDPFAEKFNLSND